MIVPDPDVVRDFLGDRDDAGIIDQLLAEDPWLFRNNGIDFEPWATEVLHENGLQENASLHLVGSAATGFSLAPEKAGAQFRTAGNDEGPSDLDFAIVSETLFMTMWNDLVNEDATYGPRSRPDQIRVRVYWGRIDQNSLPYKQRPKIRKLVDSLRRRQICRGHYASIRIYRRLEDLKGYSTWCVRNLRRTVTNEPERN